MTVANHWGPRSFKGGGGVLGVVADSAGMRLVPRVSSGQCVSWFADDKETGFRDTLGKSQDFLL